MERASGSAGSQASASASPSKQKQRIFKMWVQMGTGTRALVAFKEALTTLLNTTKGCAVDERWLMAAMALSASDQVAHQGNSASQRIGSASASQHLSTSASHHLTISTPNNVVAPDDMVVSPTLTIYLITGPGGKRLSSVRASVQHLIEKIMSPPSAVATTSSTLRGFQATSSSSHGLQAALAERLTICTLDTAIHETCALHDVLELWSSTVPVSERTCLRRVLVDMIASTGTKRLAGSCARHVLAPSTCPHPSSCAQENRPRAMSIACPFWHLARWIPWCLARHQGIPPSCLGSSFQGQLNHRHNHRPTQSQANSISGQLKLPSSWHPVLVRLVRLLRLVRLVRHSTVPGLTSSPNWPS